MNRVRLLRLKNNLKQAELARILDVSQASLSGYENGKFEPDQKTLLKLADYFAVTTDYLLGKDDSKALLLDSLQMKRSGHTTEITPSSHSSIPSVCNGGSAAIHSPYVSFRVVGDDMEPRIVKGDSVILHKQSHIVSGDIAVWQISEKRCLIRKVIKKNDDIILIPFNIKYEPLFYTKQELDHGSVTLLGKVIEIRGRC